MSKPIPTLSALNHAAERLGWPLRGVMELEGLAGSASDALPAERLQVIVSVLPWAAPLAEHLDTLKPVDTDAILTYLEAICAAKASGARSAGHE